METVFIADDEQAIRDGLKCIVDWEACGFSICGEAGNGEDALKGLLEQDPSLALLDVRMPKMMGTEVIRRARAAGYTGKCIILSGYSDFTYAQEAIENGVSFYITKPLDEDELSAAVQKIREELSARKAQSTHLNSLKEKAAEMILKDLVNGSTASLSEEELELLLLKEDSYQIAISESFRRDQESPYGLSDLLKVSKGKNRCFEVFREGSREVVLFKGSYGQRRLADILEHYDEETQEGSALGGLFLTYGCPVADPRDIPVSYAQARKLMDRRFFCPMDQHYMGYEELPDENQVPDGAPDHSLISLYGEQLKNYIQIYNHQQVADTLQSIKDYLSDTTGDIASIKMFLMDLYWQVKENIIRTYPTTQIDFPSPSYCMQSINHSHYLYEIILFLSEQANLIMDATGNPNRDTILDEVLYYIDNNFTTNIKLESLAPLFGYNSAYLGKIFHKAMGKSFNTYVDIKRIEASKKMLEETDMKVYEISDLIGYKNVDYFHKKFKKYVGKRPAEYRKSPGES